MADHTPGTPDVSWLEHLGPTKMGRQTYVARRFGSATVAVLLPIVVWIIEVPIQRSLGIDLSITRAATSIVCIGLLLHSWSIQRRFSRSRSELGFWTCLLTLPLLGATWLGLNVARSHWYPIIWTDSEVMRWNRICQAQFWIERAALLMVTATILWGGALLILGAIQHLRPRKVDTSPE